MTKPLSDATVERVTRALRADITATLGAGFTFDLDSFVEDGRRTHSIRMTGMSSYYDSDEHFMGGVVDDVQQYIHDLFIDTTWPACPRHPHHPMWLRGDWWCCGEDRISRLGELALLQPGPAHAAAGPVLKTVALATNVRLTYAEQGDPDGIPVVLLHGFTDSWRSFERVLPHLPETIRALALTQRGHGDSERPASGYLSYDFAADIAAFLDALGLERAVIVGHSMGATNGQWFAIDYPDRVSALLLAASFTSYRSNPVAMEFWESAVSTLADPIDPAFVREFQQSTLAQPIPAPFLETVIRESQKVPARVWREAFQGFLEDDVAPDLGRINAPTLIVWGDLDSFCRRVDQDALLEAIPHARLIVYEKTGHALHWEHPERFAVDLIAFVKA